MAHSSIFSVAYPNGLAISKSSSKFVAKCFVSRLPSTLNESQRQLLSLQSSMHLMRHASSSNGLLLRGDREPSGLAGGCARAAWSC
jgi:hypothetical protein